MDKKSVTSIEATGPWEKMVEQSFQSSLRWFAEQWASSLNHILPGWTNHSRKPEEDNIMLLSCINSEKIVTSISSVSSLPQTLKAIVTISQFSTKVSHFVANVVYFAQIDGVPQDELVKTERAIFGIEDIFVDFIPFLKGVQGAKITPDVPVISNLIKQEPGNVSTTPVIKKEPDVHEVINGLDRDTMSILKLHQVSSTCPEAANSSSFMRAAVESLTRSVQ